MLVISLAKLAKAFVKPLDKKPKCVQEKVAGACSYFGATSAVSVEQTSCPCCYICGMRFKHAVCFLF